MGFGETFKALSDPARRDILSLLREGRMSAGLVFETREKNYIYYTLNTSVVEEVMLWLSELKGDGTHAESE